MRKRWVVGALVGAFCATTAQASFEIKAYANTSQYTDPVHQGGEYEAVSIVLSGLLSGYVDGITANVVHGNSFQTFCIEATENFKVNTTYDGVLNSAAIYGGGGALNGADPISYGTAWLYSQFAAGLLPATLPGGIAGYNYTLGAGRASSATALQEALWYLEEEKDGVNNKWITYASDRTGKSLAELMADANGAFGVMAINTWDPGKVMNEGHQHQDWLVIVPEPATILAGVLLLLPFGASTLRVLRRRA